MADRAWIDRPVRRALAVVCAAALAGVLPNAASGMFRDTPLDEAVAFFPGPLMPLAPPPPPSGAGAAASSAQALGWVVGGPPARPGPGWWALVCRGDRGCALHATRLKARPVGPNSARLHEATQRLEWSPLPFGLGTAGIEAADPSAQLIGVFRSRHDDLRFKPGPVVTWYHAGMALPRPGAADTLDIDVPLGRGRKATLVPRQTGEEDELHIGRLELRLDGRRQALPGYRLATLEADEWHSDVLRWAGDLDGDGQLDLVLSHDGTDTDVALYLSSLALPDDLVGPAGSMKYVMPDAWRATP